LTEKELNQLHWINKEIGVLKRQKEELEAKSYVKGQEITDMPFGSGISDKTADRAVAIQEINELYEIKLKELYLVRGRIERYINTIEDERERLIIRLRCINDMEWDEIGQEMGYHRTRVSQIYHNHFKPNKDSHNSHVKVI
jgi:DNA-directed RNA polymerase specialized sigma subunit